MQDMLDILHHRIEHDLTANPKLTEAVKAASRRAAENGIGESREGKKTAHNSATMSKYANRIPFGKDMKDYTIVAPQMSAR